jgi:hypothetical protein
MKKRKTKLWLTLGASAAALVTIILGILVAIAGAGRSSAGGAITAGAWAPAGNVLCLSSGGLMLVEPHHVWFTNGVETRPTPWIDITGPDSDPVLFLSTLQTGETTDGWIITSHISGDQLTFESLRKHFPDGSRAPKVDTIQKSMAVLTENQPWRRCSRDRFPK